MSKLEVDKIDPQSGTDLELGTSGDTITIPTGVTLDASNATTTLPANVVTTDGTQTLTNKSIAATQLTGTITPSDGTVTNAKIVDSTIELAKLSATGTKDATTFLRGDNTFAVAGGDNTPAFFAYANSTQSVATNTFVKAEFTNEIFDTDSCYASNRFTPTTAGKYVIVSQTFIDGSTDTRNFTVIYKNGSYYSEAVYYFWSTPIATQIIDFNGTSDYVEIFMRQESGTTRSTNSDDGKFYFYGYKLIGV